MQHPEKERNVLLFGLHPVMEAIKSGKEIDRLFVQVGLTGQLFRELRGLITSHQIPVSYVPVEKLNRITQKNHQGVLCFLSSISYHSIENILPTVFEQGKIPLLLILDKVTDVRNFGAIARTAECAGVDALIIPSKGSAQITGDAIKTSAGALHKIPVCRSENLKTTIEFLKNSGVQIVASTEKAKGMYSDADFTLPTALIFGSEEEGISAEYLKRADVMVKIPLLGEIGSLNVSVAAGIVLFEAVRQRMSQHL